MILSPDPPITLDNLEALAREFEEIERRRAALVVERDTMIRELRSKYVPARRIGKITGLSLSAVYKIQKETHV